VEIDEAVSYITLHNEDVKRQNDAIEEANKKNK